MNKQAGFTLIELVMVIVILGILAAVAIPKFVDLSDEAEAAAVQGLAGSLASANAINYAACAAGDVTCAAVASCAGSSALLQGGLDPLYQITPAGAIAAGSTATCAVELVADATVTAPFTAINP